MAHADHRSAAEHADRVRDMRRAGSEAQAATLRGVHAEGTP
jgi:hypothetical protein